jgi:hypothetical protein
MPKTLTTEETKALNQKLIHAYESMQIKHVFKPKQLVRWKQGLKNKGLPEYNEPVIVWEILSEPRYDNSEGPGTPYFYEPLDIVLAVLDEDEDFVLFHYDSRRFEPVSE